MDITTFSVVKLCINLIASVFTYADLANIFTIDALVLKLSCGT